MNAALSLMDNWKQRNLLVNSRWPWHLLFWVGYVLFRFWLYYITIKHYKPIYLEYMLLAEILFVAIVYFTIWLYKRLFQRKKYLLYFSMGVASWVLYLIVKTAFQLYYLRNEPSFRGNFSDIVISNLTFILVCFLFVTSCKIFKDGYITQHFDAEKRQQQLAAEVNNLKSQIAPHFLFNTLNNLYGLAVERSEKLPGLMLQLSDLLRHSLYETQKPLVPIKDEINVLKSYIELESIRLEDNLKLKFNNSVPNDSPYQIAPLILIVFIENAFKHARLVRAAPVDIYIEAILEESWFSFIIRNNYNEQAEGSANGIGLMNVKRRLEVLYPDQKHQLVIFKDELYYTVNLGLQLTKAV